MRLRSSVCGWLAVGGIEKSAVENEICMSILAWKGLNLRDDRDICPESTVGAARYGKRYVTTKLNYMWCEGLEQKDYRVGKEAEKQKRQTRNTITDICSGKVS